VEIGAELIDGTLKISVCDSGTGIPHEARDRIFEPFFTSKSSKSAREGMGIGLSTAQSIVVALGGQVECASAVGQGTTFHVVLPLRACPITSPYDGHCRPSRRFSNRALNNKQGIYDD